MKILIKGALIMRIGCYHFTLGISHLSKGKLVKSLSLVGIRLWGHGGRLSFFTFHKTLSKR